MSNPTYANVPSEARHEDPLAQLALDLRWTWNHSTDQLWKTLDPELWDLTHNPWVVLQTVSRRKLETLAEDPSFRQMLKTMSEARLAEHEKQRWFHKTYPDSQLK